MQWSEVRSHKLKYWKDTHTIILAMVSEDVLSSVPIKKVKKPKTYSEYKWGEWGQQSGVDHWQQTGQVTLPRTHKE